MTPLSWYQLCYGLGLAHVWGPVTLFFKKKKFFFFSSEYFWLLCTKSGGGRCVDLCLGLQVSSIINVCFYARVMLFKLLIKLNGSAV